MASTCLACNKNVQKNREGCLQCEICRGWRCKNCSKGLKIFICSVCEPTEEEKKNFLAYFKKELKKTNDSVLELRTLMEETRKDIHDLKSQPVAAPNNGNPAGNPSFSTVVREEMGREERNRSLVLAGLDECDADGGRNTSEDFNRVIKDCLVTCDPSFDPAHLEFAVRMGDYDPNRNRLTKIILRSSHLKRQVLSGVKNLKERFGDKYRLRPSKTLEERRRDSGLIKRMFDHNNDLANKGNFKKINWSKGTLISDPTSTWTVKEFIDPFQSQKTENKSQRTENKSNPVRNDDRPDFTFNG